MMEVKGLKLSSSFYFADYDKFKSSFLEKTNLCQNPRIFRGLINSLFSKFSSNSLNKKYLTHSHQFF